MDNLKSSQVFPIYCETETSKTLCTVTISQRMGTDPPIVVYSPDSVVGAEFYGPREGAADDTSGSLNTMRTIQVCDIKNSSYVDYINAIAMCYIKNNFNDHIIVAESIGDNVMAYSPMNDCVYLTYLVATNQQEMAGLLKDKCIAKFNHMKSNL